MTFEERLDKLTERHEALTQTVELMAHLHQEDYRRMHSLIVDMKDSLGALARIAEAHERRISGLEDGPIQ